jgi:hypothetical protein
MARQNEQPPGTLRLARRQNSLNNTTKPVVQKKSKNDCRLNMNNDSFVD